MLHNRVHRQSMKLESTSTVTNYEKGRCAGAHQSVRETKERDYYRLTLEMHGWTWSITALPLCWSGLLLLLVWNSSCLGLALPHLPKVHPNCTASKRVRLRRPAILLIGSPEPPNQRIQAAPSLAEGACARCRWLGLPVEHTPLQVDLGLPKLIEVPEELKDMVAIALRERYRWPLVPQIMAERVPIPPLLGLISARCCWLLVARRSGWPQLGYLLSSFTWHLSGRRWGEIFFGLVLINMAPFWG